MNFIYRSQRVGKNGKVFSAYKIRTLKENTDKNSNFTSKEQYTKHGRFLRKYKIDEMTQLINVLKGEMRIFGYRPEEERSFKVLPKQMQEILKKEKPGLIDLSSVFFFNEEEILQSSTNPAKMYWEFIKPIKFTLQCFYFENRSWLLNLAILWAYFKKVWNASKK